MPLCPSGFEDRDVHDIGDVECDIARPPIVLEGNQARRILDWTSMTFGVTLTVA